MCYVVRSVRPAATRLLCNRAAEVRAAHTNPVSTPFLVWMELMATDDDAPVPRIETYTGKYFNYRDPTPESICLPDIAHALSNICRFAGHSKRYYSVAEHCVLVSYHVPLHRAAEGLLHDAAEAYYGDVVAPFKPCLWVGEVAFKAGDKMYPFQTVEENLLRIIFLKYGLRWPLPEAVLQVDKQLAVTEYLSLISSDLSPWIVGVPELKMPAHAIVGHLPSVAEQMFLGRAHVLGIGE